MPYMILLYNMFPRFLSNNTGICKTYNNPHDTQRRYSMNQYTRMQCGLHRNYNVPYGLLYHVPYSAYCRDLQHYLWTRRQF